MASRVEGVGMMEDWQRLRSGKERGEWAELQFMAAAGRSFTVCKPWGESSPFDVGIEYRPNFLRVQVKSSTNRIGRGYWCDLTRYYKRGREYTLEEIDMFAAYLIPVNVWYLIPAAVLFREGTRGAMLFPLKQPVYKNSFHYERYKEAWWLVTKSRRGLSHFGE
jgi:hypothetical protein